MARAGAIDAARSFVLLFLFLRRHSSVRSPGHKLTSFVALQMAADSNSESSPVNPDVKKETASEAETKPVLASEPAKMMEDAKASVELLCFEIHQAMEKGWVPDLLSIRKVRLLASKLDLRVMFMENASKPKPVYKVL
jgi:tRNA U34 5-methylaminomethyl-2-thiouridine-forming methyltransferase MnmC